MSDEIKDFTEEHEPISEISIMRKVIMNKISISHIVVMLLTFLFVSKLNGQVTTELIPYRLVPSGAMGYGCWLEVEFIGLPQSMHGDDEVMDMLNRLVVQKETGEIGFNERDFRRNGKNYILVKIQVPSPYDVLPKSIEVDVEAWDSDDDE
jgi:hypothetical protein